MATIRRIVAHDTVRFLPTQEWSVCERECIAKNTPPNVHRRPKCQNHPRFPFPPQTIPAKAGISQCSACKYRQIPTNLRPPEDHSCVGRNLITTCRQRRRLLCGGRGMATIRRIVAHDTVRFLPTQEWSVGGQEYIAKNTPPNIHRRRQISTAAAPNVKIAPDSHSPHRPFLRRQESHSVVHTNIGKSPTNLRPPQDHSCEGRNLIAICRQRRRLLGGGRGMATIKRIVAHDTVRFLPTQEWSRGGRECIAKNTPDCCPHNCQNRPRFPFPPQDHSCGSRNLFLTTPTAVFLETIDIV